MVAPPRPQPRPSPATHKPNNEGCTALGVIIVIIIGAIAVSRCSSSADTANNSAAADLMNDALSNGIEAQSPPPVEPLAPASVTRGVSHLRLAMSAEGIPGAMIYSQNCYDALSRRFAWSKLDLCGAFDMLAVRSVASSDASNLSSEATYFESETAAGRYLAAATGAGLEAGVADARLDNLQSRIARLAVPARRAAPPAPTSNVIEENLAADGPAESLNKVDDNEVQPTGD